MGRLWHSGGDRYGALWRDPVGTGWKPTDLLSPPEAARAPQVRFDISR